MWWKLAKIWIRKVAKSYRRLCGGEQVCVIFTGVDGFSLSALHQKLRKNVEASIVLV